MPSSSPLAVTLQLPLPDEHGGCSVIVSVVRQTRVSQVKLQALQELARRSRARKRKEREQEEESKTVAAKEEDDDGEFHGEHYALIRRYRPGATALPLERPLPPQRRAPDAPTIGVLSNDSCAYAHGSLQVPAQVSFVFDYGTPLELEQENEEEREDDSASLASSRPLHNTAVGLSPFLLDTRVVLEDDELMWEHASDLSSELLLEAIAPSSAKNIALHEAMEQTNAPLPPPPEALTPVSLPLLQDKAFTLAKSKLAKFPSLKTNPVAIVTHAQSPRSKLKAPPMAAVPELAVSFQPSTRHEQELDLQEGLDVCLMSMHGTYLHSPASLVLDVSCLDAHCSFTLIDSMHCIDEDGNPLFYLRNQRGEYLSAAEDGRLYLEDVTLQEAREIAPTNASRSFFDTFSLRSLRRLNLKQQAAPPPRFRHPGTLQAHHRWSIKRGASQSLQSHFGTFISVTEEGMLLLTERRFEESCLHICFAILQGQLQKKRNFGLPGLRSWPLKWFVLSGSSLTFFDHRDDIYDKEMREDVARKKNSSKADQAARDARNYSTAGILSINVYPQPSLRFDVEFVNGRVLEVKAPSEIEREQWVHALRQGKISKRITLAVKEKRRHHQHEMLRRQRERQLQAALLADQSVSVPQPLSPLSSSSPSQSWLQTQARSPSSNHREPLSPHRAHDVMQHSSAQIRSLTSSSASSPSAAS